MEYLFERCRSSEEVRSNLLSQGSGYLLYKIVDDAFDYCFPMLRKMGNKLERIEEEIFEGRGEEIVRDISNAKQEIINFRKIIRPQRAVLRDLERTKQRYIADDLEIYFDDINDASERIWDMLENYKEVVEALEDTNESVISHRVNEVLKVLTAFSVVILPLTLLASMFGMNVGVPVPHRRRAPSGRSSASMVGRAHRDGRLLPPARLPLERRPWSTPRSSRRTTFAASTRTRWTRTWPTGSAVPSRGCSASSRASRWATCAWRSAATCGSPRRRWPPATREGLARRGRGRARHRHGRAPRWSTGRSARATSTAG